MERHKQRHRGRGSCEAVSQLGLDYRVCHVGAESESGKPGLYRGRDSFFILVVTGGPGRTK